MGETRYNSLLNFGMNIFTLILIKEQKTL